MKKAKLFCNISAGYFVMLALLNLGFSIQLSSAGISDFVMLVVTLGLFANVHRWIRMTFGGLSVAVGLILLMISLSLHIEANSLVKLSDLLTSYAISTSLVLAGLMQIYTAISTDDVKTFTLI